jgi:glycosyltransferase involved in cell wall biosynthesis
MKICQINPGCGIPIPPPTWGAIEKIVWEFTQNLIKLGHEVDIKFVNEIQPGDYDIVHCHVANLAIQLAEKGIPYIYQLHDHHAYHYGKGSNVYNENLKAIENSIIALMPAKFLVDYFESDKCVYFSHGVNTDIFKPRSTSLINHRLLCVANNGMGGHSGRDRKGFALSIAAAIQTNLPITIAGPNNNKHFFNENLWTLSYPKLEIIFEPTQDELIKLYQEHTIFLHPSELEAGHPNLTLLEAASCGLPISGWIEMETDFYGMWRAPRDVFEIVRGINDIITNYKEYKQAVIKHAQSLSWLNRSKELIEIYERNINKGIQQHPTIKLTT